MKPKTQLQRTVIGLSSRLAPITDRQLDYGYKKCLINHVVRSRKTLYCLECGAEWKDDFPLLTSIDNGCKCPECGLDLKLTEEYKSGYIDRAYYGIITTKGGMQVIRFFLLSKLMKKGQRSKLSHMEVMQHWINDKGKLTVVAKSVHGLSGYVDSWVSHSELEIRSISGYGAEARAGIIPLAFYPSRRVLPIFKRNGYNGHFYGFSPQEFLRALIQNRQFETLIKAGQISLARLSDRNIQKHWPSIRIAIRNKYMVKNASDWIDYLDLLRYFGKDLRNSKYVCPQNLKEEHDRLVRKKRDEDQRKHLEELRKEVEAAQIKYEQDKSRFFDLCFSDGDIVIKPISKVEDFMKEGDELRHCVFANEYYKRQESLVLSARIGDKPIETIEVSLKRMKVVQARGENNKPTEYHEKILSIMNRNMGKISERVTA